MTSFGLGEIGIVVLIALIFFDAKQVGKAVKWFREMKVKIFHVQRDFKEQVDKLIEETEVEEEFKDLPAGKNQQRDWGIEKINLLTPEEKSDASEKIVEQLKMLSAYRSSKTVAAYASLMDELDTQNLLAEILNEGKSLFLPYVEGGELHFSQVKDPVKDLESGNFGIREPLRDLRQAQNEKIDLMLIPGRCFDESGGRIGRGKGYYDKYLENNSSLKVGICFDVQISGKKLNMEPRDIMMDYIISDKRFIEVKKV